MFDAPLDAQPSWNALHEVLRDPSRNFLFDHLGAAEDEQNVVVRPDCADLPYFLRAYFAFKLGLPFGWSRCSRGENGVPPVCGDFATQSDPFPTTARRQGSRSCRRGRTRTRSGTWEIEREAHGGVLPHDARRRSAVGRRAHAGRRRHGRLLPGRALRPSRSGRARSSPTRTATSSSWPSASPQTATSGGVLLAVDGQPDGTVARKRFWRGNFLFAVDPALGSAGFKRFRPVDARPDHRQVASPRRTPSCATTRWTSTRAASRASTTRWTTSCRPRRSIRTQALLETIDALEEQVKTRVNSVDNGRKFLASGKAGGRHARRREDLRDDRRLGGLLDAVARPAPAHRDRRGARRSRRASRDGRSGTRCRRARRAEQVRAELEARLREGAPRPHVQVRAQRRVATGSCRCRTSSTARRRSRWPTTRTTASRRAGARRRAATRRRPARAHAPAAQVAKMNGYRNWFHERKRPPR